MTAGDLVRFRVGTDPEDFRDAEVVEVLEDGSARVFVRIGPRDDLYFGPKRPNGEALFTRIECDAGEAERIASLGTGLEDLS